jgi:hypothetical protein
VLTRYIFSALALVFLIATGIRVTRDGGRLGIAARTWLTIAIIFGAVGIWLWWSMSPR